MILDEITSSLDEQTEDEIMKLIETFKGKKTIIIISHKKEVVHICDRVLEIKNNTLKEI